MSRIQHTLTTIVIAIAAFAFLPTYASQWVRIDVDTTAVYSITYQELTDAGFTDPANVSVWGYGGCADVNTVGRPMAQVPTLHRNGHIYFYGLGPEQIKVTPTQTTRIRNPYAATGSYFLTDTATPTAPVTSTATVPDNAVVQTTHTVALLWEREDTCPALGGTEWFTHNVMAWNGETVDFDLSSVADATISLYVRYAMYTTRSNSVILTPDQPNLSILSTSPVRAPLIGSRKGNVFTRGYTTTRYTASPLPADGTLSFTPSVEYAEAADYALIDYATLTYKRHNDLNGLTSRTMYFNEGGSGPLPALFTGVSTTTEIWDITDPMQPKALILTDDGKTVIPRAGTTATLVAFDTSRPQRSVRFRGINIIDNIQAETTGADMIIITATPLMETARELAGIHEQLQGMKVTVCDQQSIFNAYSSGTPHPESIRRYVTDATQTNSNLRYLLIYGAANFNNRIVLGENSPYVLTYQCESETYSNNTQYAFMSDDFYAITDSRNPIDGSSALLKQAALAVGRITVYGTAQGREINEKIRQWTANAPKRAPGGNALLMCDSGDDNSHMHFICKMATAIDTLSAGSTTVTKAYPQLHEFAINSKSDMPAIRKTIATALTHGTGLMLYAGHCDVTRLGQEYIWRTSDTKVIHTPVPVAMLATCDALSADRHSTDIARTMLFNPRGGAMGVIGACRAVLQPFNEEFAADVVKTLYTADKPLTLGDLYYKTRTTTMARAIAAGNIRLAVNTMSYALAGDPAIPIYNPHISITAAIANNGLVAGGLNRISGDTDPGIEAVEVTVYAAPDTVKTYLRKPYAEEPVRIDSRVLARTTIAVNDGKFDSEFYLPASAKTSGPLRITLHASGNQGIASGVISDVAVIETTESDDSIRDIVPEITEFTVSESGRSTVTVHAVIDGGPTGVAMTGQPGMITHMKLDNNKIMPGTDASLLPLAGGKVELDYTISDVTDGYHTLTLTTYTAAGTGASATTEFTVVNVDNVTIDTDSAAVSNEAIINVNPALPADTESELMITDMSGTIVLYVTQPNLPFIWNLTDNDSMPVATGCYQVTIMTRRGHSHGASSRAIITVIRDHDN